MQNVFWAEVVPAPVLFATDEAPKNSPLSAIRESEQNQRST